MKEGMDERKKEWKRMNVIENWKIKMNKRKRERKNGGKNEWT